jgi:hypothetical protein
VRLTLKNITWDMLNVTGLANSPIIDAIAAAAGVSREQVVIGSILSAGRRRLGEGAVTVLATVWGASRLRSAELIGSDLIHSLSWSHRHSMRVAREELL